MPESWDLLDAIRELVSCEGWDKRKLAFRTPEEMAVTEVEERIAKETGLLHAWKTMQVPVGEDDPYPDSNAQLTCPVVPWVGYWYADEVVGYMLNDAPPFLRSRDAAAMLEEAIGIGERGWFDIRFLPDRKIQVGWLLLDEKHHYVESLHLAEPVARTLAALEAGYKLGLWPVKA